MTERELQEIEERAGRATSAEDWRAPWDHDDLHNTGLITLYAHKAGRFERIAAFTKPEDAEFTAGAFRDIPALVAEVRRLRNDLQSIADHTQDAWALGISMSALGHKQEK